MKSIVSAVRLDVKTQLFSLVTLFTACSGTAFAGCNNLPSTLSQAQLDAILSNNYACGRSAALAPPGWNEKHVGSSGGTLVEQHESGSADDETVGSWSTSTFGTGPTAKGRVTYTYSGTSFVYEVAVAANGDCSPNCTTLPQTYQFCGVGGAPATLNILVTAALPTLSSCPAGNP